MQLVHRALPTLASLGIHAAVIALAFGVSAMPDLGSGAGEEDLGGDADTPAELVPEGEDLDFGPPKVKIVAIGIVDDAAPVAAPAASPPPPEAAAPVVVKPEVVKVDPKPPPPPPDAEAVPEAPKPPETADQPPATAEANDTPTDTPAEPTDDANAAPPADAVADASGTETAVQVPVTTHYGGHGKGRKATGKGKRNDCPVNPASGVVRTSPNTWEIQRDIVEFYAGHIKELMKLGSVRANRTPEGKLRGFRVGVAKCSLLRDTGFRTGDLVQDVNGMEVHDVLGAIGAYLKLRKQSHFEIHLVRRGKPMTLIFDLT